MKTDNELNFINYNGVLVIVLHYRTRVVRKLQPTSSKCGQFCCAHHNSMVNFQSCFSAVTVPKTAGGSSGSPILPSENDILLAPAH